MQTVVLTTTLTETLTTTKLPFYRPFSSFVIFENRTIELHPTGSLPSFINTYNLGGYGDCIIAFSSEKPVGLSVTTFFEDTHDNYHFMLTLINKTKITNITAWAPAVDKLCVVINNYYNETFSGHIIIACRWIYVNDTGYGYVDYGVLPEPRNETIGGTIIN